MIRAPYISFVAAISGYNCKVDQFRRFQFFMDHLSEMTERHQLEAELLIIDWNSESNAIAFEQNIKRGNNNYLDARIITVPKQLHLQHQNSDKIVFFEMIARNTGIRRAEGEFLMPVTIDTFFTDDLFSYLAKKQLERECLYSIVCDNLSAQSIPGNMGWKEYLQLCRTAGMSLQESQNNAAVAEVADQNFDFDNSINLLAREKWLELKGYPEFHLGSSYIEGLFVCAAKAYGLKQVVLTDSMKSQRICYKSEVEPLSSTNDKELTLDYEKQYLPLCKGMLARKRPLDINGENWGLYPAELGEAQSGNTSKPPEATSRADHCFDYWLQVLTAIDNRLYYRDQSAQSLSSLAEMARKYDPDVIVELGTLSGLSTRVWALAAPKATIHAVDLSFATFWKTSEYLPVDTTRMVFHEKNILEMDFRSLWKENDKVLFFVDAHDLPGVPIVDYVINQALPHLPAGSVVAVDDLWFSSDRLDYSGAQQYFDRYLLGQIDEVQCFSGYYAPYHKGGSFMGFQEVVPLMAFINSYRVDLQFEQDGKHVWFEWDAERHKLQQSAIASGSEQQNGVVEYNPLCFAAPEPLAAEVMPKVVPIYEQGDIISATNLLIDLINSEASQSAAYALAVCQARLGRLQDSWKLAKFAREAGGGNWRIERLFKDLEARVGRSKVRMTGRRGLTIFAVPKPFVGHDAVIQKNAIRSWARLNPKPEIILLGSEPGVEEMAREVGAITIPEVSLNEFGTPLVNDIFQRAWAQAENDILAYVNADIILMNDLLAAADRTIQKFGDFLIVGQRWDLPLFEEIDFSDPAWGQWLRSAIEQNAFLHGEAGLDYFIHPRGLWGGMPPLALGRTAWDNWLVKGPQERGSQIVDGTGFITAVHQDHGYGHCKDGRRGAWRGLEASRNRAMAGAIGNNSFTTAANWMFNGSGELVPKPASEPRCQLDEFKRSQRNWFMKQAQRLELSGKQDIASFYHELASDI